MPRRSSAGHSNNCPLYSVRKGTADGRGYMRRLGVYLRFQQRCCLSVLSTHRSALSTVFGEASMSAKIGFRYHQTIGLLAQSGRGFSLPVDFAFGQGVLYVNRGTPVARNTHVTICTVDGDYRADFGSYGTGDGQFIWPTAAAVDRDGCVYVSSETNIEFRSSAPPGSFSGSGARWATAMGN